MKSSPIYKLLTVFLALSLASQLGLGGIWGIKAAYADDVAQELVVREDAKGPSDEGAAPEGDAQPKDTQAAEGSAETKAQDAVEATPDDSAELAAPVAEDEVDAGMNSAIGSALQTFGGTSREIVTTGVTKVEKTVSEQNPDGSYTISMSATGASTTEITKSKVDVLFVLDYSGSMGYFKLPNGVLLGKAMKDSVSGVMQALENNSRYTDYRASLVWFNGCGPMPLGILPNPGPHYTKVAGVLQDWQTGWNPGILHSVEFQHQTNYEAGLIFANEQVDKMREDASKVVVFLSDGDPNRYVGPFGNTLGVGSAKQEFSSIALSNAVTELSKMDGKIDSFYVVGLGQFPDKYKHLSTLATALSGTDVKRRYFEATDQSKLEEAFNAIKDEVITRVSHVTLTDTMSKYVDITSNADNANLSNTWLRITGPKGGEYRPNEARPGVTEYSLPGSREKATLSIEKGPDGKERVVVRFPERYALDPDFKYEIVTNVKFNDAAWKEYKEKGTTSFLTNDNDETTFRYYEGNPADDPTQDDLTTKNVTVEPKEVRPFTFQKVVAGDDAKQLSRQLSDLNSGSRPAFFTLKVTYPSSKLNTGVTVNKRVVLGSADMKAVPGDGTKFEYSGPDLFNLPDGATVEIVENQDSFKVDKYELTVPGYTSKFTIDSQSNPMLVAVRNEYKKKVVLPDPHQVVVSKKIKGSAVDENEMTKQFDFKLTITSDAAKTSDGENYFEDAAALKDYLVKNNASIARNIAVGPGKNEVTISFKLAPKGNSTARFSLPSGFKYTITEENLSTKEYSTPLAEGVDDASIVSSGVSAPMNPKPGRAGSFVAEFQANHNKATITNYKNLTPPTLVSRETIPFALMAGGGGLALISALAITWRRLFGSR